MDELNSYTLNLQLNLIWNIKFLLDYNQVYYYASLVYRAISRKIVGY